MNGYKNCVIATYFACSISLFGATMASAQNCGSGYLGVSSFLPKQSVAVVFKGIAEGVDRVGATETVRFRVERVWKGRLTERVSIYRPVPVPPPGVGEFNPTIFERGERYIVIAHRLNEAERQTLRVPQEKEALGTDICGDGSRPFSIPWVADDLHTVGPGWPPVKGRRH